MKRKIFRALALALLAVLVGCGGQKAASQPVEKAGVVYVDPNAAPAATAAPSDTPAPLIETATAVPAEEAAASEPEATAEAETEAALDLYFESKGVRMKPMMEAAPVLSALGDPIGSFEADSCAYIGKDLFYYYPGFELTVNEVEGVDRITAITVADDTVTTPQGLRIYDDEEKLLDVLGGTEENGVYTYRSGSILLLVRVKEADGDARRVSSIEYRPAEDQ